MSFPRYPVSLFSRDLCFLPWFQKFKLWFKFKAPLSFIRPEDAEKLAEKSKTDGFYYDQADGFYYDGFYYDGFARDNGFYVWSLEEFTCKHFFKYQQQQNRQVAKYQQGFYYDQEDKKWKDRQVLSS